MMINGSKGRWWGLAAMVAALLVVGLDTMVLNVALPTLAHQLGATTTELQWLTDSYTLAGDDNPERVRGVIPIAGDGYDLKASDGDALLVRPLLTSVFGSDRSTWAQAAPQRYVRPDAAPFVVLLSRTVKRQPELLVKVAAAVLVVRMIDLWWLIGPEFHTNGIAISWMDAVLPLTIGALWLTVFVSQLRGRAILPVHDPEFDEALGRIIERGAPPRTAH